MDSPHPSEGHREVPQKECEIAPTCKKVDIVKYQRATATRHSAVHHLRCCGGQGDDYTQSYDNSSRRCTCQLSRFSTINVLKHALCDGKNFAREGGGQKGSQNSVNARNIVCIIYIYICGNLVITDHTHSSSSTYVVGGWVRTHSQEESVSVSIESVYICDRKGHDSTGKAHLCLCN